MVWPAGNTQDGFEDPTGGGQDPNLGADLGYESSLSNWAGDYVTEMLGKGWALSDLPYSAFQGPLSAPTSSLQDQAFSGIAGLEVPQGMGDAGDLAMGIGGRYDDLSGSYTPSDFDTNRWTDQGIASSYMNPFIEQALTPELNELRRQSEITRLNDAGRLTKAGAYGGSRQAIMESELNDNMLRLMAERTGKGYRDAYDTGARIFGQDEDRDLRAQQLADQSRQFGAGYEKDLLDSQLDAATTASRLYDDEFRNSLDLLREQKRMGDSERDIYQQGIDADRAQFEEERDYPFKMVQFMQSLLQNLPLEAQQNIIQQPSGLSELLGGTGGIISILDILFGGDNGGDGGSTPPWVDTLRDLGII